MKSLMAATAIMALTSTAVIAEEYATITAVKPNYQNISVPRYRTDCKIIEVPVYGGRTQGSTGDTVLGAIIGGAVGNQFGQGSGKDAMTVLGAIVGADVANKNSGQPQIIGYRQEQTCNNVTYYETQEELKNYTIRYEWRGIVGSTVTYNNYRIGDRLPIDVTIRAK